MRHNSQPAFEMKKSEKSVQQNNEGRPEKLWKKKKVDKVSENPKVLSKLVMSKPPAGEQVMRGSVAEAEEDGEEICQELSDKCQCFDSGEHYVPTMMRWNGEEDLESIDIVRNNVSSW